VLADPELLAPVAAAWPLEREGVRVVPLRPAPQCPWYAVWRTAAQHPALLRLLRAVRAAGAPPAPSGAAWLPRAARER
jgi:hypothetical protein